MTDAMVQKKMKDTKAAKHFVALEELQRRVANEPERQCYGLKDVKKARDAGAIDILMISDELFRSTTLSTRKQYVELVEEVKNMGNTTVHIFSSGHVTGQALGKLTGIAAILRFQIDYDFDEEDLAAEPVEQAAAPDASPAEAASGERKLVRQDSAPQREQAVKELALALGGSVADDRILEALKNANKVTEDAYLALLVEELDGGGKQPGQDDSFVPPTRQAPTPAATPAEKPAATPAQKPAAKPAAKTAAKQAAKPAAKPAAKSAGKKQKPAARLNTGDWDDWGDW